MGFRSALGHPSQIRSTGPALVFHHSGQSYAWHRSARPISAHAAAAHGGRVRGAGSNGGARSGLRVPIRAGRRSARAAAPPICWSKPGGQPRRSSSFDDWLRHSRKLILHAGGQSRRLPAYAPTGKLLMPMPVFRWSRGQRLDQSLLDLQLADYQRVLAHAGPRTVAMLASGDMLLRFARELPPFPDVDVLGLGMWVTPEKAKDFGVFFSPRGKPTELAFFLQKAAGREHPRTGQELSLPRRHRHVAVERTRRARADGALRLGRASGIQRRHARRLRTLSRSSASPSARRRPSRTPLVNALTCAVVPLPEAEFYHFGTSAQMIESVSALQNLVLDETKLGRAGAGRHPDQ